MTAPDKDSGRADDAEAQVKACYATWAAGYHRDYYTDRAAYPPVHLGIVRDEIRRAGVRRLIDAGCGPASMLRELADLGLDLQGFDLTPDMVAEARRVLAPLGVPAERVWEGSVLNPAAFRGDLHDAALCFGVLPHIPPEADAQVFANLHAAVRPGGLVMAEMRNQLFALFTFNRYSRDFLRTDLIRSGALRARADAPETLDDALEELDPRFRLDLPPVRGGRAGEPGYDEVLSRTHNPLVVREQFAAAGFSDVRLLFYHFHCLPPMLEAGFPAFFRTASLDMEDPTDWRGHFMASAFIVAGRRI